jgi:hypothetical protein
MGEIVFWAIIRCAIVIPAIYIAKSFLDYTTWWGFGILAIYAVVVHPIAIHYHLFLDRNKEILDSTLCSSCKNFERTAVLCSVCDKHPTREYLPCEGLQWEPNFIGSPKILQIFTTEIFNYVDILIFY